MTIYIDDPHNLIINKLRFGSQQDHEDALAVLVTNIDLLDIAKLKQKAESNNVYQELIQLFSKANIDITSL